MRTMRDKVNAIPFISYLTLLNSLIIILHKTDLFKKTYFFKDIVLSI